MAGKIWMGIDPGANGGIAMIHDGKVDVQRMPKTEADVWHVIKESSDMMRDAGGGECLLEEVTGFIGRAHPGSSMFNFGWSYGGLRMALIAAGIRFCVIRPHQWQTIVVDVVQGEEKADHKRRLRARASNLYPDVKTTLATCDALLIAHVCQLRYQPRR